MSGVNNNNINNFHFQKKEDTLPVNSVGPRNYKMSLKTDDKFAYITRTFTVKTNSGRGTTTFEATFTVPLKMWMANNYSDGRSGRHVSVITVQMLANTLKDMTLDEALSFVRSGTRFKLVSGVRTKDNQRMENTAIATLAVIHPDYNKGGAPVFIGNYSHKRKRVEFEHQYGDPNKKDIDNQTQLQVNKDIRRRKLSDSSKANPSLNKDERAKELADWLHEEEIKRLKQQEEVDIGRPEEETEQEEQKDPNKVTLLGSHRGHHDSETENNIPEGKQEVKAPQALQRLKHHIDEMRVPILNALQFDDKKEYKTEELKQMVSYVTEWKAQAAYFTSEDSKTFVDSPQARKQLVENYRVIKDLISILQEQYLKNQDDRAKAENLLKDIQNLAKKLGITDN